MATGRVPSRLVVAAAAPRSAALFPVQQCRLARKAVCHAHIELVYDVDGSQRGGGPLQGRGLRRCCGQGCLRILDASQRQRPGRQASPTRCQCNIIW